MAKFSASGVSGALTTTNKTALGVRQPATPLDIIKLYTLVLGSAATPADNAIEWTVQKGSTAGTSTSVTPTDVEDTAQVASALVGQTYTAEPTAVSNSILFDNGLNLRATYTIVMGPGYEWKIGLTAARGFTIGAKHASATPTVNAVGFWDE